MNGSWFFDENFNGVSDDFFDDAIKFLNFSMEDVEPNDGEDWQAKFQHLDPPPSNVLVSLSSGLSGGISNEALRVQKSCTVSSSAEASSSGSTSFHNESLESKHSHLFQTSSPISVLDSSSSSSCSAGKMTSNCVKFVAPVKRPRSKRHRAQRHAVPFISTCYTRKDIYPLSTSDLDSESESFPGENVLNPANKGQKKKKNLTLLSCTLEIKKPSMQQAVETRKCSHCEVSKTPQWREGPMGPKTLCNACGVRYRSGRLLPEYRPAASPAFIPSLHSNSHRKVLEMRKKAMLVTATATMGTSLQSAPEY